MEQSEGIDAIMEEVRNLVTRTRASCLWFAREDYSPESASEAISCLEKIQRQGDRNTYVQARRLREWLLLKSRAKSSS
jgi:hypothetical protein